MADTFLEELLVVLKRNKCFRGIMENSEDIIGSLNVRGISRECLNLDKNFRKLQVVNSPSNLNHLHTRDGILHKLSFLWDLFHAVVEKQNLCCSLHKFCQRLCEEDFILQVLFTCLGSEDHFIAFQAHKVVREIVQGFPEIILQSMFQELVSNCLKEKKENGKWKIIYIIEIIKEVLTLESSLKKLDCEKERPQSFQRKCDCLPEEQNQVSIDFEAIWNTICCYWLDLCNKCLAKFPLIAEEKQTESNLNKQSCYISAQQMLASLLSVGSIIMHSHHKTYHLVAAATEIGQFKYTNFKETSEQSSFDHTCKPRLAQISQSHEETKNKIDKKTCQIFPSEQSKYLNMESVYKIVEKLVGIDKQELSLNLRRTIMQFLNDVVGDDPQSESELYIQGCHVEICICLLLNIDQLLENGTKVTTDVLHFGGQNFKDVSSEKLEAENQVYDKVMTRKVLLLVLKLVLITLHVQEERSRYLNWEVLQHCLESWLNFVGKAIGESCENLYHSDDKNKTVAALVVMLFSDQDDELMTVLLCLFNLYQELFLNESSLPATEWTNNLRANFNPHCFFLEFLHSINYDHSLLLDFLISNETCFLPYFLSYLRHVANDWFGFLAVCNHSALLSIKNDYAGLSSSDDGGSGDDGHGGGDDGISSGGVSGDDGHGGGGSDAHGSGGVSDDDDGHIGGCSDGDCHAGGGGGDDHYDDDHIEDHQDYNDYLNDYKDHIDDTDDHIDDTDDHIDDTDDHIDDTNGDMKSDLDGHDLDNYSNQCVRDCMVATEGVIHTVVGTTRNINQDQTRSLSNLNHLHQFLSCLIRLRFSIERMISKELFPYPVQALVRVIKYIESLYEGE